MSHSKLVSKLSVKLKPLKINITCRIAQVGHSYKHGEAPVSKSVTEVENCRQHDHVPYVEFAKSVSSFVMRLLADI